MYSRSALARYPPRGWSEVRERHPTITRAAAKVSGHLRTGPETGARREGVSLIGESSVHQAGCLDISWIHDATA